MVFDRRIELLTHLQEYILSDVDEWQEALFRAEQANGFFTQPYLRAAIDAIIREYLSEDKLRQWMNQYPNLPTTKPKSVGIVMAGNIPLVGMHDFICVFISGHIARVKLSSKDTVLWQHIFAKLESWEPSFNQWVVVSDMLKSCDAYIATGSNNSATYFRSYFEKYPHIIRKNRTSVAILDGSESDETLRLLAEDILSYFGLGCRNVTKLYVPIQYDFTRLLSILKEHDNIILHHKYKNNYDYYLAIYLLNKVPYRTNDMILLVENAIPFSPIATVHYEYYEPNNVKDMIIDLDRNDDIQAIVLSDLIQTYTSSKIVSFGDAQCPHLHNYADGVDTMEFLSNFIL